MRPAMQAEQQSERERFEAWFEHDYMSGLDGPGEWDAERNCYVQLPVHMAWCAYRAALSRPSTPQGWKLVPVEPTKEMLAAGESKREEGETNDEYCAWNINAPRDYWDAMLDAAPPPPAQGGKG